MRASVTIVNACFMRQKDCGGSLVLRVCMGGRSIIELNPSKRNKRERLYLRKCQTRTTDSMFLCRLSGFTYTRT